MDNVVYWYPLAKSLADFLSTMTAEDSTMVFEGVDIYTGTKANGKTFPCIEITWDNEAPVSDNRGMVILWMDICLKNSSNKPGVAYELMYEWQTKVIQSIPDWALTAKKELGIAMKLNIPDILSDGDVQRPVCQSRIILEIEWRTSRL